MIKRCLMLLILITAVAFSKVNVGFYSLKQKSGDTQNAWIGYALVDILSKKLSVVNQLNIVKDDQIYDFLVSENLSTNLNSGNIKSFTGEIKEHFDLDFVVTGNYSVNSDGSMPAEITVYDLNEEISRSPVVIQGFSNDLHTMVSYITQPVCNNMELDLSPVELSKIKQIDLTVKKNGMDDIYKGKINMRNKEYKDAADFFEEALRDDPTNTYAKEMYDEALGHFYGSGIFAYELLETDYSGSSPFRKQYMITRKISRDYDVEITSTELSPKNVGSHFDVSLGVELTLPEGTFSMVSDLIKKFASGGQSVAESGYYNPNATKVLNEREIFEKNVENFQIMVRFMDGNGNVLHRSSQSFKSSFDMSYSGAVKDNVFHKRSINTVIMIPSVTRKIIRNTKDLKITVE
ncbi:MAG: tetratricopeptide repeat protein [Candidatus Delongbacteria bacterium]